MAHGVSLDSLRLWTNVALKDVCRKKGLITSGRKDELIARVFAAHELNLPDLLSAEKELKLKAAGYQRLLQTSQGRQPDPFCELEEGWLGEESGKHSWPPTMYCDICTYFLGLTGDVNRTVSQRALNAYKEGKAFSYFDSGWLKELFYHPVSDTSQFCFMKTECTPSQRIDDVAHNAWVLLEKKSGAIQSAYCTCFAGLGSTCNHIAALLFKMDFFWRQGLTNKACTSKGCSWNQYGNKPSVTAKRVEDLHFRKPQVSKQQRRKKDAPVRFENLDPFSFKELASALGSDCPDAVVFQSHKSVSPNDVFEVEVQTSAGPPLCELLNHCSNQDDVSQVLESFTAEHVSNIEKVTRGQSVNRLWKLHRVNRLTASVAHDVSTRMKSLQDPLCKRSKDPNPILKTITKIDNTDYKQIPQLKYGVEMEKEAREEYRKAVCKKHKNFVVSQVGLVVSCEHPQYGASPDGVVSCACCDPGLLEIKCPLSISHTVPSAENLPYLIKDASNVCLSVKHKYYSQAQWQMGICQKSWCDFFVYTRHGYYLQKVMFDEEHFDSLQTSVSAFYNQYVIPKILSENQVKSNESTSSEAESVTPSPSPSTSREPHHTLDGEGSDASACNFVLSNACAKQDAPKTFKKRKVGKKSSEPIYLCDTCGKECLSVDNMDDSSDSSVQCMECYSWFHFTCVSFTDQVEDDFLCPSCKYM